MNKVTEDCKWTTVKNGVTFLSFDGMLGQKSNRDIKMRKTG